MNAPVRMGILGCAGVVEYAIMAVLPQVPEIQIAAIASRDRRKSEEFVRRHGLPIETIRASYEAVIADPALDAIYVPLPNSLHCEWTIRALEAGKAVLCEKPLAVNAIEAERVAHTVERTGGILVEGFHWRYHPLCGRLLSIIGSGVLGELRRIDTRFLLPGAMVPPENIRWQYGLGSGATMDTGCYCVNFLRLFLGEPERVIAADAIDNGAQVDGRMQAELLFSGGRIGGIDASQIESSSDVVADARFAGERGELRVTFPFAPQYGSTIEIEVDGNVAREPVVATPTYFYQARAFAEVVRNRAAIKTTASDALANMRVIDAIYRAAGMLPRGATN